jgi:lysyl-tRNA synthetase class II
VTDLFLSLKGLNSSRCLSSTASSSRPTWPFLESSSREQRVPQPRFRNPHPSRYASSKEANLRLDQLPQDDSAKYPRYHTTESTSQSHATDIALGPVRSKRSGHDPKESDTARPLVRVIGRVVGIRRSGRKLVFLDVQKDGSTIQLTVNLAAVNNGSSSPLSEDDFHARIKLIRRGDHISKFSCPERLLVLTCRFSCGRSQRSFEQFCQRCQNHRV